MDNKKELINPVEFFPTSGSKFIRSPDQVDQEKKNTSGFIKPVQFEERHKDFEDKVYVVDDEIRDTFRKIKRRYPPPWVYIYFILHL